MAKKRSARPAPPARVESGRGVMSSYERIAWVCLHLLVFIVPIAITNASIFGTQQAPYTYDQFDIIKVFFQRGLVLIAFAAWLIGLARDGGRVRWNKTGWIVLAFLAWVSLTTLLSVHPATAIFGKYRRYEGLLSFMTYASWFFLTLQLVDRESRIRSLARTLVISGAVVSFYGVLQYLGADPIKWQALPFEANRAFSFFGNPDLLGGYLIFPLAIALGLALSEKNEKWRIAYWAMFLLTGFTLLVSFVRGAWIGGFVALVILVYAAFRARFKPGKIDWSFIGASGAAAVFAIIRSLGAESAVLNFWARLTSIFQFGEGSARTRFEIWSAALAAIKERPIFGWGPDTFRLLFPRFKPAEYVADAGFLSVADNVHNYPLQLASAIGLPGALLFYGLFGYSLAVSAGHAFVKDKGPERLAFAGFWAAIVGYLVHLIFGLSVTGSTIFLWVSLGVVVSPMAKTREVKAVSWNLVVLIVVLAIAVFGSYGNLRYIAADHAYLTARVASSGLDRVAAVEEALTLNPYNDMYVSELGVAWKDVFASSASVLIQMDPSDATYAQQYATVESNFANAEAAYLAAIEYTPMEYDNYVFLANLYNQASYYLDSSYVDDAITAGLLGVQAEQYGPAIRLQLAIAYMNSGEYEKAIEHAKFGADLDPNYVEIRAILGDAYRYAGQIEEAKEQYRRVLQMQPDRTDIAEDLAALEATSASETTGD